ncbi:MAG: hypothetical protein ACOCU6_01420 [Nanoarchaeota archaeon]
MLMKVKNHAKKNKKGLRLAGIISGVLAGIGAAIFLKRRYDHTRGHHGDQGKTAPKIAKVTARTRSVRAKENSKKEFFSKKRADKNSSRRKAMKKAKGSAKKMSKKSAKKATKKANTNKVARKAVKKPKTKKTSSAKKQSRNKNASRKQRK